MAQPRIPKVYIDVDKYKQQYQQPILADNKKLKKLFNVNDNFYGLGLKYNPSLKYEFERISKEIESNKDRIIILDQIATMKKSTIKSFHSNITISKTYIDRKYNNDEYPLLNYTINVDGSNIFSVQKDSRTMLNDMEVIEAYKDRLNALKYDNDVREYIASDKKYINNESSALQEYQRLTSKEKDIEAYYDDLKYKIILGRSYGGLIEDIERMKDEDNHNLHSLQSKLEQASYDIFALATLNIYKRHYNILSTSNNSVVTFRSLINSQDVNISKYTDNLINNFDTYMTMYNLANNLFEQNKENSYNASTKSFNPHWVPTREVEDIKAMETLPSNIKVDEDNEYLVDINNTKFEDLPLDIQIGNFALAKAVMAVNRTNGLEESVKKIVNQSAWLQEDCGHIAGCTVDMSIKDLCDKTKVVDLINEAGTITTHQKLR